MNCISRDTLKLERKCLEVILRLSKECMIDSCNKLHCSASSTSWKSICASKLNSKTKLAYYSSLVENGERYHSRYFEKWNIYTSRDNLHLQRCTISTSYDIIARKSRGITFLSVVFWHVSRNEMMFNMIFRCILHILYTIENKMRRIEISYTQPLLRDEMIFNIISRGMLLIVEISYIIESSDILPQRFSRYMMINNIIFRGIILARVESRDIVNTRE